jgi:hypothetical protein
MGRTRRYRRGGEGETEKSALTSLYEWGASALGVVKKPPIERATEKIKSGLENTKTLFTKEKESVEGELSKTDSVSKKEELRLQLDGLVNTTAKIDALIEAFKHIFSDEPAVSPPTQVEPLPVDNLTPLPTPAPAAPPSPDYGDNLPNMPPDAPANNMPPDMPPDFNMPADMPPDYNMPADMPPDYNMPQDYSMYERGGSRRLARRRRRRSVRKLRR